MIKRGLAPAVAPQDEQHAPTTTRGRVLLSYGHDDACRELVQRIYKDLEDRQWKPWLDDSIPFGADWRGEISAEIQRSGHMLAFLSRHSTRKPGVCRQEIAIALGPGNCHVYTVLVEAPGQVTPPLIISHLQWLDMHKWQELKHTDQDKAEELYQRSLADILRVLEENRPFEGQIERLRQWLRPLDNTSEMVRAEDEFGGRDWLLAGLVDEFTGFAVRAGAGHPGAEVAQGSVERFRRSSDSGLLQRHDGAESDANAMAGEIERWRRHEPTSRVFWLAAPPGWGKSAVAARLAHSARAWVLGVHFCRHDQPDTCDARQIIRTLAFQMATQLADYRVRLCQKVEDGETLGEKNAVELFRDLVVGPLIHEVGGNRGAEGKLLIVLDAIDETLDVHGQSELLDLVASDFGRLPQWLGLVVTSRPESQVKQQLGAYGVYEQSTDDPRNLDDVRAYARRWIGQLPLPPEHHERALAAAMDASEGNFLYMRQLRDAVRGGALAPERLIDSTELPAGLAGLYMRWFRHRFSNIDDYQLRQRPLFDLMMAAREPLPRSMVSSLLAWSRDDKTLGALGSLCLEEAGRLRLFHRSLHEWLGRPQASGPHFSASADAGHREMASALWRAYAAWREAGASLAGGDGWVSLGPKGEAYALAHLPAHLLAAGMNAEYREVLADFAFAMRRAASGHVEALVADYRALGMSQSAEVDDKLAGWSARILESEHLLQRGAPEWPPHRILLQVAVEGPDGSALTRAAQTWVDAGGATWPWMRRRGQASSTQPTACRQVLFAPPMPGRDVQVHFRSLVLSAVDGSLLVGTSDGRVFDLDRSRNKIIELRRQIGEVGCMVASTRGDRFASIVNGGRVLVWSRDSSFSGIEFNRPSGHVRLLAFSPDGGLLACAFRDGRVRLRDLDAQRWIPWGAPNDDAAPREIDCGQGELRSIAWASEGQILATVGRSGDIRLWNTTDGSRLGTIVPSWCDGVDAMSRQLKSVALSKDGRVGIAGSEAGIAWVFDTDVPDHTRPLRGHSGPIHAVAITPCGGYAVTGGADKAVRLWNLGFDDELEAVFKGHDHLVTRTLIDPSGDTVFSTSSDGTLRIWDRRLGRALRPPVAGDAADWSAAEICALANGSNGLLLVGYKDGRARALDGRTLTPKSSPPPHAGQVWAIAAMDGTHRAVSAGWDGTIRIWDVGTGQVESENLLPMSKVYGLRYADSGRIWCWGERVKADRSAAGGTASRGAEATTDPASEVVGRGAFLELDMPSLSPISALSNAMPGCIRAMAVSPNGQTAFAGGHGGELLAFGTKDGRRRWAVPDAYRKGIYAMSLTPNGKRLASGGVDRVIRVRDSSTGRLLMELPGHSAAITSLEFASDSVRLVSASWDGTVRLWDTREGHCLAVAHLPGVSKVLASADGQCILAGTTRGELLVLDLIGIAPLSAVSRV